MAQCLPWKAKDVRRLMPALLLLFISHTALPQYIRTGTPKKITLTTTGVQFHTLIEKLSEITGLNFIYSSNKIEVNKSVSLSVTNRSLDDVLLLLGRQTNLTFARRDRYVIIKTIAVSPALAVSTQPIPRTRRSDFERSYNVPRYTPLIIPTNVAYTASAAPQRSFDGPIASTSGRYFNRHLGEFKVYFDTTFLKKLPAHEIQKINLKSRHASWFISAGVMVNDFAAGGELQAGIRSLYVVYNPSWLYNGNFYGSYGLGTSVLLSKNLSFNPVYTYGTLKQDENLSARIYNRTIEGDIKLLAKLHQVRLMLQYSITKNISLRAGPTLGYMRTKYSLEKANVVVFGRASSAASLAPIPPYNYGYKTTFIYATAPGGPITEIVRNVRDGHSVDKYLVGWEASISYRINFFKRP
jgi:hypothetical protein